MRLRDLFPLEFYKDPPHPSDEPHPHIMYTFGRCRKVTRGIMGKIIAHDLLHRCIFYVHAYGCATAQTIEGRHMLTVCIGTGERLWHTQIRDGKVIHGDQLVPLYILTHLRQTFAPMPNPSVQSYEYTDAATIMWRDTGPVRIADIHQRRNELIEWSWRCAYAIPHYNQPAICANIVTAGNRCRLTFLLGWYDKKSHLGILHRDVIRLILSYCMIL